LISGSARGSPDGSRRDAPGHALIRPCRQKVGGTGNDGDVTGTTHRAAVEPADLDELLAAFDAVPLDLLRRRTSAKWTRYPPDVLPAWVAELDVPLSGPIRRALHEAVDLGDTGYTEPDGLPAALAEFAGPRLGWTVDPDQVYVVPDVMVGVAEILRVATPAGAGVVINPPVYQPFFDTVEEVGRVVVEVPLARSAGGGWELDLDGLEAAFRAGARAYLLCSPHNPTGRVWPAADLHRVTELAARYDVLVLADEVHAPLTLAGARHTPFLALGGAAPEYGIVLTSASKAWNLPGLKCAVAVTAAPRTRALLDQLPAESRHRAGILGVRAGAAAFGDDGPWLDALQVHLDRNRRLLADLLAERLPEIRYLPPEASYLAWLDCTGLGLGDDPAAVFLDRGRVALERGLNFGRPGAGFARLNIGTSRDLLIEVVDRMAAAVGR
jgi:cystathionine beta-lyase